MRYRSLDGVCVYQRDEKSIRVLIRGFNLELLPLLCVLLKTELFLRRADDFGHGHWRRKHWIGGFQNLYAIRVFAVHAELGPVVYLRNDNTYEHRGSFVVETCDDAIFDPDAHPKFFIYTASVLRRFISKIRA